MCGICVDLIKGKLTAKEAKRNLMEIVDNLEEEHYADVVDKIAEMEKEDD